MTLETFKNVMALAPAPVAVVTAYSSSGEPRGLTVSAVCSVSLSPPLVLTCLAHSSATLSAVQESCAFTINYLAPGQAELAQRFATKEPGKFSGVGAIRPRDGIGGPVLEGAIGGYVACLLDQLIPAGDHAVVLGAVIEAHAIGDGLAYGGREFFSRVPPVASAA
jgi:flavin reductase (DIM6/NTAB) family NADH-FMN oxidoreductase RutF